MIRSYSCCFHSRDTEELVNAYMRCLDNDNQDVVLSAAKFIPQLVLLADSK